MFVTFEKFFRMNFTLVIESVVIFLLFSLFSLLCSSYMTASCGCILTMKVTMKMTMILMVILLAMVNVDYMIAIH